MLRLGNQEAGFSGRGSQAGEKKESSQIETARWNPDSRRGRSVALLFGWSRLGFWLPLPSLFLLPRRLWRHLQRLPPPSRQYPEEIVNSTPLSTSTAALSLRPSPPGATERTHTPRTAIEEDSVEESPAPFTSRADLPSPPPFPSSASSAPRRKHGRPPFIGSTLSANRMAHCQVITPVALGVGLVGAGERDAAGEGESTIVFTSPFGTTPDPTVPRDFARSTPSPTSSSRGSISRRGSSDSTPGSRRGSQSALTSLRPAQAPPPFPDQLSSPHSPTAKSPFEGDAVDLSRRRSVDVGVLGLGSHRPYGAGSLSKKVREAVGPDAADKETGVVGSGLKGGKDRLCVL